MRVALGAALVAVVVAIGCAAAPQSPAPRAPATAPPSAAAPSAAAPAPAATAPIALERVRAAYGAPSASFMGLWLAKEAGLFEKYGLDVEMTYIAGGQILVGSAIAGELDIGELAAPTPMAALLEGGDTVWLTGAVNRPLQFLLAAPDIARVEDLRGRAVGVTRLGSTTHIFLKQILRATGLDPERDVQALQTGGVPETVASIQTGRVAAGIMGPPSHLVGVQAGLHVLADAAVLGIPWPYGGTMATRGYVAAQPERVRRYVKAYAEALHLARTDRERTIAAMVKYADIGERSIAETTYDIYRPYWSVPPYPDPAAMEVVIREELVASNPRARELPPQAYYDDRFVRELEESGFVRQLLGT
jgi:NitT/TauT family transport system substrate-binding protein